MSRSNEAIVNDAFKTCTHLISDMGKFSNVPPGCPKHKGFAEYSKLFCDSIVFWGLYNAMDETTKGASIGKYTAVLREIFTNNSLQTESIKCVTSGFVYRSSEYFSSAQLKKHKDTFVGVYASGYIAIKVSLHDCRAKKLMKRLGDMLSEILDNSMALHDVDFTHDCQYVSTRYFIQKTLKNMVYAPLLMIENVWGTIAYHGWEIQMIQRISDIRCTTNLYRC